MTKTKQRRAALACGTFHLQTEVSQLCADSVRQMVIVPQLVIHGLVARQQISLSDGNKWSFISCTILHFQ